MSFILTPGPAPRLEWRDGALWAKTPFPDVLAISTHLLRNAPLASGGRVRDRHFTWNDDYVTFRLANGTWVYRIRNWNHENHAVTCTIVYREER